MNNISMRIEIAIANIARLAGEYWAKTLAQRAGANPLAAGSIYDGATAEDVERMVRSAAWEPYSHPAVMADCTAFRAQLPGRMGIVELSKLDPATPVVLDDRKGTGAVSATVKGVRGEVTDFSVLILGKEQGEEVIFTFHPGDPVRPSQVKTEPGLHGKQVTVEEAMKLGLLTAKIV